jgi:hypothetical protein
MGEVAPPLGISAGSVAAQALDGLGGLPLEQGEKLDLEVTVAQRLA